MGTQTLGAGRRSVPTVALVHDQFSGPTGMGLVLNRHAQFILETGWNLCVVGGNVPKDIRAAARVVPVRSPRNLPSLLEHMEWCRRALGALRQIEADIVHVHSPLLAVHADIQTSHFVSQAAFAHGDRTDGRGVNAALRGVQAWVNRRSDGRLYARARSRTYLSFVSEFLRDEFCRLYGEPRGGWVFRPPMPKWQPPTAAERANARYQFGVTHGRVAVGYLGGVDSRKGFADVLALQSEPDLHVLMAGPGSERVSIGGRPGIGFVDVGPFLSACDVLAAPTRFDPAPVAVLEGLSRGVPVVTTSASGWASAIERHGCGAIWRSRTASLAQACRMAAATSSDRCRALADELAPHHERQALVDAYGHIMGSRGP